MSILDTAPDREHLDETAVPQHHHTWNTESRHRTSDGLVRYLRCDDCGRRRVEVRTVDPRDDADLTSREIASR